ncbi:MAG: RNA polymerase sigma factor [Planctomycetia bacterium]|nr:RNA polymerase sigma factor [Planctomycetia bacterium]
MAAPITTAVPSDPIPAADPSLVERHRGWLERLVAARTCSRDAVDDVLQEVALAVARTGQPPVGEHEERPWVCTIAIRQCALFLRRASRRARLRTRAVEQRSGAATDRLQDDPIYWLMAREDAGLVARALAGLGRDDRQLLEWKYVEEHTYPQLAARLEVPRHVVEYRVVTAKKRLRGLLIDMGLGEDDSR